jgi:hypothetical protein
MFKSKFKIKLRSFVYCFVVIVLASCSKENQAPTNTTSNVVEPPNKVKPHTIALDVYKSPSCGCCKAWINHVDNHGFESKVHTFDDFPGIKEEKYIAPRYRSCHTAISADGYVFEGHVPAKYIQQFIKQTHSQDVIGLSVPAMPVGSPGMEVDDRFQPYRVLLLKVDGSYEIYANVQSYEDQF